MRECRRVFSRRSLLWLLVLMAAVVFFHRVDHHNAPGFAAAYRQTVAQLAASPDPSAALSQMEAESRRYMTALLWRSTDDPDLLELYRDQARQVLGDDYETAAMAYDLSDQAQVEFTARQQAQQTLRQQLDYLASYPGYLDTIHENAANMPTLSIFMDSSAGKFHAENVKKTDRDFPRSADVSLTLTETAGLENFLQDSVVSVCILLWMLVTVLRLTEERRSSLRYLVFGSPRGRTWLALRRVGILGLSAALGTALLMLTGLVTDSLLYGGLGDLSAAAQSSEIFQNFPYPLTLRQVLWAYYLLKTLGMWLMGLLLWLILQLIHHLQTAMVAAAAFLAVEYSLFAFVPDSYAIVALRYINVFSFVGMEKTFLHYLNINLLGRAVNGAMLCTALLPVLLVLAAAGAVVYAGHHRPIAGANVFQRLAARLRPVFSRASGRLTLTGFEFKKILWYHKGLLVLLVFALWCFRAAAAPTADVSLYDTDTAAFQNEFQGPATEDTLRAIRARIAEVEGWPESEIRSTQLAALSAVEAEALEKQDTGLWVLNPAPMFTLCGGDVGGSQRIPSMAALLTVALLTAGVFAGERQQRMLPLLQTTPRGRRREPRCKLALSALLAAAVWLTLTLRQVYQVSSYYGGLTALSAPLRSVTYFADLAADCTVGQWLAGCLLLRLLVLLAAAMTGCMLSSLCRTVNAAVVVCCAGLVGPAALELVGVRAAGILSLARLWTPVTCSLYVYLIPLALLVVCPLLCVRHRPRV